MWRRLQEVFRLLEDVFRSYICSLGASAYGGSLPCECSIQQLSGVESPPTQTTIVNSTAATNPFLGKNPIPLSNHVYTQQIQNTCDICIQEHWPHTYEQHLVKYLFTDCKSLFRCHDTVDPISQTHYIVRRGHAGVAIMWRTTWDMQIC